MLSIEKEHGGRLALTGLAPRGALHWSGQVARVILDTSSPLPIYQCGIFGAAPVEEINLRSVFSAHPGREWRLH